MSSTDPIYTNYIDRHKLFAKSVLYDISLVPEYLIYGKRLFNFFENIDSATPIWPEYNEMIYSFGTTHNGYLTIWRKTV